MDKSQGRTNAANDAGSALPPVVTHSGHRGLNLEEKLIFEQGVPGRIGVDVAPAPKVASPSPACGRKPAVLSSKSVFSTRKVKANGVSSTRAATTLSEEQSLLQPADGIASKLG